MALKPVCNRCGKPHWRFVRCDEVEFVNKVEAARRVTPHWRDKDGVTSAGERLWGDRLDTISVRGGTVWRRWDGDDAA